MAEKSRNVGQEVYDCTRGTRNYNAKEHRREKILIVTKILVEMWSFVSFNPGFFLFWKLGLRMK